MKPLSVLVALSLLVGCSGVDRHQLSVSTQKENGETRVTCVLPHRTFDDTSFVVHTVVVRDASGNSLPASHEFGQPNVSFVAPDQKVAEITLDVLYMDHGVLQENKLGKVGDGIDWQVRHQQFKLSDALKNGEPESK